MASGVYSCASLKLNAQLASPYCCPAVLPHSESRHEPYCSPVAATVPSVYGIGGSVGDALRLVGNRPLGQHSVTIPPLAR
jgi:hypothetical protein